MADLTETQMPPAQPEDTTALGGQRADQVVGRAAALVVWAVVTGSLALARGDVLPRALVLVPITALLIGGAVWASSGPRGRHARGRAPKSSSPATTTPGASGRRARRRSFLVTTAVTLLVVVVLLELGWWSALFVLPGALAAVAVVELRHHRLRLVPGRPRLGWFSLLLVPLLVVGWSVETTLAAPGQDPSSVRMVEWLRDHGGEGVVNSVERWWYTNHPPPVGGAPKELLHPATTTSRPRSATGAGSAPPATLARVPSPAGNAIGAEGVWVPVIGKPNRPAVATTLLRPDAVHTSLVVGLMRIDPSQVRLRLMAGTEQPDGISPNNGTVFAADLGHLVAAFNAGFRVQESAGGWFSEGHMVGTLRNGAASLVLRDDGRADVGTWGRDDTVGPHVIAVRQNLVLIVDGGAPVAGVSSPNTSLWGKTLGNRVLVWRSGVGVTKDGMLVYAGGPGLSVDTLAKTLVAAGAVRAMELDINTQWVDAYTFQQSPTGPVGTKLVDLMRYPPDHYLIPQSRDFVAVLTK